MPGRTVRITLVTDWAVARWGFCVDQVASVTALPSVPNTRVILVAGICSRSGDTHNESWDRLRVFLRYEYGYPAQSQGDAAGRVIEFGYAREGWSSAYGPSDTVRWGIAAAAKNLADIYTAYPNDRFFIVAHSLGGLVAAYALSRDDGLGLDRGRTAGLITINSPLRGVPGLWLDAGKAAHLVPDFLSSPAHDFCLRADDQVAQDLSESSDAVNKIALASWSGVLVVNLTTGFDDEVPPNNAGFQDKGYFVPISEVAGHGALIDQMAPRAVVWLRLVLSGAIAPAN